MKRQAHWLFGRVLTPVTFQAAARRSGVRSESTHHRTGHAAHRSGPTVMSPATVAGSSTGSRRRRRGIRALCAVQLRRQAQPSSAGEAGRGLARRAVAGMVPAARRGTAYGVFNSGYGLLWFAGSALMGVLYDVSLPALIAFSVVAQLIAVPVLFLVGHRRVVS